MVSSALGMVEPLAEPLVDGSEERDFNRVGIGLYTIAEASRLTGISQGRLRCWLHVDWWRD